MRPLVSLISVHYNHLQDTIEFLEAVMQLTYPSVEVIVVDNASPKEPITDEVIARFPKVKFIKSEKNLGFAGGNNVGLSVAKGAYLFLLNNDTVMTPSFLDDIIEFMESHPDAGVASPKVMYPDGKTIQYAGAKVINNITGRGKRIGLFDIDKGQYDVNQPTGLGHGAALIIRREVYEKIGKMPEIYFLYYEEHDWTEQAKRLGYNMYYLGKSSIIHKESVSTGGEESPLKVYYMTRNRILFMRRNVKGLSLLAGSLFFTFVATPKALLKYLVKGKTRLVNAYLKGVWWNLTNRISS